MRSLLCLLEGIAHCGYRHGRSSARAPEGTAATIARGSDYAGPPVTLGRAAGMLVCAALLAGALTALAARAPAELRRHSPERGAADPQLGATFTRRDVERGAAFNRSGYVAVVLSAVLGLVVAAVLARGPFGRMVDAVDKLPGGWATHALALGATVAVLGALVTLPCAYVQGFAVQHAWGLSTQSISGWAADRLRSAAVSAAIDAVAVAAFFGIVRWQPRAWWLWGWAAFAALNALLVFVWPVVVAPLFNRFTPLQDPQLERKIVTLARRAGVDVEDVLVADASRRSSAENAYVAGLGATKRLVLFDTLLRADDERQTLWVVGHELGHEIEGHVEKGVLLSAAGLGAGFLALAWLSGRGGLWAWAGAAGVGDLRALPVVIAFVTIAGMVTLPVASAVSRGFERRADAVAARLTGDRDAGVGALRRLALANIADLDPPPVVVAAFYSHPPVPERIRAILASSHLD
jgi:STE24 endopeptidase